jgi:hypothetical protein
LCLRDLVGNGQQSVDVDFISVQGSAFW